MLTLPLTPFLTVLLLTVGVALVYLELNRPGMILPGALGLLGSLLAIASISKTAHAALTTVALFTAFALLYLDDRRPRPLLAILAGALLLFSFRTLDFSPTLSLRITTIACAVGIAFGSHVLNRVAYQARVNKGAVKSAKTTSKQVD